MPWKRMAVSEQRVQFLIRATSGRETMQGLCGEFGISRPTGYLWRRRYETAGSITGLGERSRRPRKRPGPYTVYFLAQAGPQGRIACLHCRT